MSQFLADLNRMLAAVGGWLNPFRERDELGVRSQRMCPFCGLITACNRSSCLECGKILNPA